VLNLKQILDVLGIQLSAFFSDITEREKNIFSLKDRLLEGSSKNYKIEKLIPKLQYLEMEPVVLTLEPLIEYKKQFEEDEGFGFVLKGNLEIKINDERQVIKRGDCFYLFFDNTFSLKNLSKKNAEILMVNY
jgi:mannose-6-phosphate isomerase-like protein (cupin superfamily)